MNKLLIPASLDGYSPRKDGSFSLRFATQEMNPSEVANVANLYNQFGYLLFQEKISLEDQELMDSLDVELSDGKTPSQRLRVFSSFLTSKIIEVTPTSKTSIRLRWKASSKK